MIGSGFDRDHSFNDYAKREDVVAGQGLSANQIQHAIIHYDPFVDTETGKLIESLKQEGQFDDTLIVIMSDHGEGLGEHGYYFEHGDHVYEHRIRVPRVNGKTTGREYTFSESRRDFHRHAQRFLDGVDGAIRTVRRRDGWKLVYTPWHIAHEFKLYFLPEDPREERDLACANPSVLAELQEELRCWIEDRECESSFVPEGFGVDMQVEERLRQLGYIE